MNIETKYNIGENVWVVIEDMPVQLKIKAVTCYTNGRCTIVTYEFMWNDRPKYITENNVFDNQRNIVY